MKKRVLFSLFLFFCMLQIESQVVHTPNGLLDEVYDRFGEKYTLEEIKFSKPPVRTADASCGYFDLYFEIGSGFETFGDPIHDARRAVLCQVMTDLSNFIVPADPSVRVNFWVRDLLVMGGGVSASCPNPLIGAATSLYTVPAGTTVAGPSIVDGEVWKTINSGTDSYTNEVSPLGAYGFYHGIMGFNFCPGTNWHTDLSTVSLLGEADLYTVILHEVTHALGFASQINEVGGSKIGNNYFGRYDLFLKKGTQQLIVNSGGCSLYNYQFNPALPINTLVAGGVAGCLNLGSPIDNTVCANAITFGGTANQDVYTPICFEPPSSLSHFEDQCPIALHLNNEYFVMSNSNNAGPTSTKRFLKQEERNALCDMRYKTTATFGSAANLNFFNYGSGCGALVAGINDGINPATGAFTWVVATGGSIPILHSDLMLNDYFDNLAGATIECVEEIYGIGAVATAGTTTTFSAGASPGITLLRYVPVDVLGNRGNVTYAYVVVTSDGCLPSSCNLIPNGDFEAVSGSGCGTFPFPLNCWFTLSQTPDVYSRTCPSTFYTIPLPPVFYGYTGGIEDWTNNTPANTNNHFVGLAGGQPCSGASIESIQIQPLTPILPNTNYTISFWAFQTSIASPPPFPFNGTIEISGMESSAPVAIASYFSTMPNNIVLVPNGDIVIPPGIGWNHYSATFQHINPLPLNKIILSSFSLPGICEPQYILLDDIQLNASNLAVTFTPPSNICIGANFNDLMIYTGLPGGVFSGPGVTLTGTTYSFNSATAGLGTHTIYYTFTEASGCITTVTSTVTVDPSPTVVMVNSANICLGSSATLTTVVSPTGGTFSWLPVTGLSCTNCATTIANPTATTTYTVTYTPAGTDPCPSSATSTVSIYTTPVASFSYSGSPYCINSVNPFPTFSAGGFAGTFSAVPAGLVFVSTSTGEVDVTGSLPGTYTVTNSIPAIGACPGATTTSSITINQITGLTVNSATVSCIGAGATLTATATPPGGTFVWSPATDLSCPTCSSTLATPISTTTYTVTYTLGGCTATAVSTVTISSPYTYPTGHIVITGGETWSSATPITVNGNVIIPSGETLTITGGTAVQFAAGSGILVQNEAVLIINGASTVLSGLPSCGNMWTGITLRGNTDSFDASGKLIINDATVRDAHIGVNALWGVFVFNWTYTGTIQATSAKFINNRIGIKMEGRNFKNSNSSINSFITSCQFTCNAPLLDVATYGGEGTKNFIELESIRQLNTVNNNFFLSLTSFAPDKRGVGISALNSNFTAQGNDFTDMTRGIESGVTDVPRQTIIDGNTFTNIQEGITIQSGELDVISNNKLNIPAPSLPYSKSYGVFMIGSNGFNIEGNFSNSFGATSPASYGMVFENSGATGGVVFNNKFNPNLGFGIQAQQDNINLKIRCNIFSTPINYSIAVVNSGSLSTLKQQGLGGCINNYDEAGNEWTSGCSSSTAVQDIFADPTLGGVSFKYISHNLNIAGLNYTKPLCSTPTWEAADMVPYICLSQNKVSTSCASSIPGLIAAPPSSTYEAYFAAIKDLIAAYYVKINALKLQIPSLDAAMDGGNKQNLLNAINSGMSPGQLKNLLTSSGPLSDEVIIATINRASPLPPGTLKNVLIPQAPQSVSVLNALENISLPSGIKNNIYSAQTNSPNYTKLSDLLAQIEYWRGEIALLESEYQRHFIVYNNKICKSTCRNSQLIDSKMLLVESYLNENKLDSARAVLAEIALADATVISASEKQNYIDYLNVLLSLADNAMNVKQMDASQLNAVQQIAGTGTKAGNKAEIALEVATKEKTIHTIADIQNNHSMVILDQDPIAGSEGAKANLYPNPNSGTMSFEYSLKDNEKGEFSIYDIAGREILKYELATGNKTITISETTLTNGIYFYAYRVNGYFEQSEKIVIIK